MTRINTNVSSLTAQQALAKSNDQLQTALTRLSTGLRINSGKDDPAGLIASEMLRGDIKSTASAISNTQRANQMIATADSGLGQISSLLNDIRGLVTEAANSGAMSADQIAANQLQVDSSLGAINRISNTTAFQGKKLLDGSLGFTYTTAATNIRLLEIQEANLGTSGSMSVTADITTAATQATLTGTIAAGAVAASAVSNFTTNDITITADATGQAMNGITVNWELNAGLTAGEVIANYNATDKELTLYVNNTGVAVTTADINTALDLASAATFTATGVSLAAGDAMAADVDTSGGTDGGIATALNFTLSGPKGSQVYNFGVNTTGSTIATAINNNTDATGVSAAFVGTTLTLLTSTYGSSEKIHIGVNSGTSIFAAYDDAGTDIVGTINGNTAAGQGNTMSLGSGTLTMKLTVTDGSSTDVSFTITGGGALFQLGPDVVTTQQTRIGIDAMNTGTLGGATGKLYQIQSGESDDLETDPNTAATIVEEAALKVTTLRGRLGALQKTTMETNIDALNDTLSALTDAESMIRDADFAAETANLTRAQILVQSGTAVLQIANKGPENVLALLR